MNFAELLKQTRKKKGLSQEEAADELHMSQATYSRYERGESKPKEDMISIIEQFCGIPAEEIQNILNNSMLEQESHVNNTQIKIKETPVPDNVGQIVFLILIGVSIYFPICAWLAIYWAYINHFKKWVIMGTAVFAFILTFFYLNQIYFILPARTSYSIE